MQKQKEEPLLAALPLSDYRQEPKNASAAQICRFNAYNEGQIQAPSL